MPLRWHVDDPDLLRQAIEYTARQTGFSLRLIEKDYFSSVVLEYLAARDTELIFKGGTCVAKVHGGFYRLSENLGFSISTPPNASRKERSRRGGRLGPIVRDMPGHLPEFQILAPLRGANESTQYNAVVGYRSLLESRVEPIGVEVGLREPTLVAPQQASSNTMVLNPVNGRPLIDAFVVSCLSHQEAMAEKVRAALTRRDVAIRDFFDVDHAVLSGGLDVRDGSLLELLRRKLEVAGAGAADVSAERLGQLSGQLEGELQPVLRKQDFDQFDLDRAIRTVRAVALQLV